MKDHRGLQEPAKLHCPLSHRTLGLHNQRELRLAPTCESWPLRLPTRRAWDTRSKLF